MRSNPNSRPRQKAQIECRMELIFTLCVSVSFRLSTYLFVHKHTKNSFAAPNTGPEIKNGTKNYVNRIQIFSCRVQPVAALGTTFGPLLLLLVLLVNFIKTHSSCLVLALLSISIPQHSLALALLSISIAQHQHCLALALLSISIAQHQH